MFRLDENSIDEFKAPLGKLYADFEDAIPKIKEASFLISVGDQTTKNLVDNDLIPDLVIIDNRIQRKDHNHDIIRTENILEADNPAGTITENLENAVVLYGQPNEGLVFVNVFEGKDKATKLMTYLIEE